MKRYIRQIIPAAMMMMSLTACDKYLDEMPDDRAEVNTTDKVTALLVSAYPDYSSNLILEMTSDNLMDNGEQYTTSLLMEQAYRFETITATGNDCPQTLWDGYYSAVAAANQALEAIDEMGNPSSLSGQRAEALMCRAFSMFRLATTFCMAYNPDKADEYLGLPYPLTPETSVDVVYERGTLAELYAKINDDIEAALPYITEDYYTTPKYHFNVKAAYAFAARFNLYYMNYDRVIEYATKVLGSYPQTQLRDCSVFATTATRSDVSEAYINSSERANLLLLTAKSLAGRSICGLTYPRFGHNSTMYTYETLRATAPWGSGGTNQTLYYATRLFGNARVGTFPKMIEYFEYTDKSASTGYARIVDAVFTSDETILCRAEAYAMKEDYANAVADINTWITTHTYESRGTATRPTMTAESISEFIQGIEYSPISPVSASARTIRKTLNPQGFTVKEGTQEDIIEFILHMRRIETLYQGLRIQDIKRYGIEYEHNISGETTSPVFKAGDLRGAIQLPSAVIEAGLEENPREE